LITVAAWGVGSTTTAAPQPSLTASAFASPVFLQQGTNAQFRAAPTNGPSQPLGAPGTSVIPPGPQPGERCSVVAGQTCSAVAAQERCSAFNDNDNRCSADLGPLSTSDQACSAFGDSAACSVLPPSSGGVGSICSTFNGSPDFIALCSSIGQADRMLCSTKGAGISLCSSFDVFNTSQCSVLNPGAPTRSFCSTKLNQPTVAKGCSAYDLFTECSVSMGSNGVCTTFGAADPASCSAFVFGASCSVIGGAPGNPCVQ
jgi:hypothetical protein